MSTYRATITLKNGKKHRVEVFTQCSYVLGELLRAWKFDGKKLTNVQNKYYTKKKMIPFQTCDNLLGVRPFENGDIAWEFLFKPLGIKYDDIPKWGTLSSYEFIKLLEKYEAKCTIEYVDLVW